MRAVNNDFPIAFSAFSRLLIGTEDEVWIVLMRNSFGQLKLTEKGWRDKLQAEKTKRV